MSQFGQVIGDHRPPDPASEAFFTAVATVLETMLALEDADPPFDPGMKPAAPAKPPLTLVLLAGGRFLPRLGQDDASDPQFLSQRFVGGRVDPAIGTGLPRRMTELLAMAVQGRFPLGVITGVAGQDAILRDETAFDLPEPDLVTILSRLPGFAPADNVRMRLKDTDDFLIRGQLFALEDPPLSLGDDLPGAGQESGQDLGQGAPGLRGPVLQSSPGLFGLPDRGPGDAHQFTISGFRPGRPPTTEPADLPGGAFRTAGAIAQQFLLSMLPENRMKLRSKLVMVGLFLFGVLAFGD